MTIVVNNNTWSKEKFLNYFVGTFQGDVLQFLRQWEESEKGKEQKGQLINQIGTPKDLLKGLTLILKTEFCGYFDKKDQDSTSSCILSKVKLCDIRYLKEFSKKFLHEYQKLKNENIEFWKNQYFHKLPPPWDEICINKYISYLEKHSKTSGLPIENLDSIGNRINFARERI
ncbi:hypothetical protein Gotur_031023, partial [Gossypium turneri]